MKLTTIVGFASLLVFAGTSLSAWGHGYAGNSRSKLCADKLNPLSICGNVTYEPQSVEGPDGFPSGGPADGYIGSGGAHNMHFLQLNEQKADRWKKNAYKTGENMVFSWHFSANHATKDFKYYITKDGWNPNEKLTRASFNLAPFCDKSINAGGEFVLHNAKPTSGMKHYCPAPTNAAGQYLNGYHVVLAVWDVGDTVNSFYNVIDVNLSDSSSVSPTGDGSGSTQTTGSSDALLKAIPLYNAINYPSLKVGDEITVDFTEGSTKVLNYNLRVSFPVKEGMLNGTYTINKGIADAINVRHATQLIAGKLVDGKIVPAGSTDASSIFKLPSGSITGVEFGVKFNSTSPTACSSTLPVWTAGTYTSGKEVQWKGVHYRAQWWTTAEPPAVKPANTWDNAWLYLSKCGDSSSGTTGGTTGGSVDNSTGAPLYVYGTAYAAGNRVLGTQGGVFECKPYPFSGWCSGAGWAYAPGTGLYWSEAWIKVQ